MVSFLVGKDKRGPLAMTRLGMISAAAAFAALTLTACDPEDVQTTADVLEGAQLVVVSLGDSFVSGEGNPDQPRTVVAPATWNENPDFAPGFCHRSAINAHRMAVARVTDAWTLSDEEIYANFACSGSSTQFGLRRSRRGNSTICNLPPPAAPPAPYCGQSQIEVAKAWAEDPANGVMRIDVVMVSIGINDLGFGGIIKACVTPKLNPFGPDCHEDPGITDMLQHGCVDAQGDGDPSDLPAGCGGDFRSSYGGFDRLQGRVEREIRRIRDELNPKHIILIGYPDPTGDETGAFCANHSENFVAGPDLLTGALVPGGVGVGWFRSGIGASTHEVTEGEAIFARNSVLVPLNQMLLAAAQAEGIEFVGGLEAATREHGVCSALPWFHGFRRSFELQGDAMGVLHPNAAGHQGMSFIIEDKLREVLGLPPA